MEGSDLNYYFNWIKTQLSSQVNAEPWDLSGILTFYEQPMIKKADHNMKRYFQSLNSLVIFTTSQKRMLTHLILYHASTSLQFELS
jgi:hypothetical protein